MRVYSLGFSNADGIGPFGTFTDFELNRVTFGDFTGDFGLVNEEVFSIFLFDKAEALDAVEPFYCTCWHGLRVKNYPT